MQEVLITLFTSPPHHRHAKLSIPTYLLRSTPGKDKRPINMATISDGSKDLHRQYLPKLCREVTEKDKTQAILCSWFDPRRYSKELKSQWVTSDDSLENTPPQQQKHEREKPPNQAQVG